MGVMVLLSSMSALFGKQISDVEYSAEAHIPSINGVEELNIHHESLPLIKLQEVVHAIGGTTLGELIRHDQGDTLDSSLFESTGIDMGENYD